MDCKEKLAPAMVNKRQRKEEEGLENLSPFEIKNKLIEYAEDHTRKSLVCFLMQVGEIQTGYLQFREKHFFYWENLGWKSAGVLLICLKV